MKHFFRYMSPRPLFPGRVDGTAASLATASLATLPLAPLGLDAFVARRPASGLAPEGLPFDLSKHKDAQTAVAMLEHT